MLGWLAAFCLFWLVASLYLGGLDVELEGGSGFRQVLGLLVMNVLFLAAYRAWFCLSFSPFSSCPYSPERASGHWA